MRPVRRSPPFNFEKKYKQKQSKVIFFVVDAVKCRKYRRK